MPSSPASNQKTKPTNLKVVHKGGGPPKLSQYQKLYKSDVVLIASAKAGISPHAIVDLVKHADRSLEQLAPLLYVTPRTIRNYINDNKLLPVPQSEQLLKLYALYDKGIEAFGNTQVFNSWLGKSSYRLNNQTPDSLLLTSTGTGMVMDELKRIMHGDLF